MHTENIVYIVPEYKILPCGYLVCYVVHKVFDIPKIKKEYFASDINANKRIKELKQKCLYKIK